MKSSTAPQTCLPTPLQRRVSQYFEPETKNGRTINLVITDKEHKMTLWQGCKLYPKAILWSVLISSCCAMEGYDISLVGNFCKFSSVDTIAKADTVIRRL